MDCRKCGHPLNFHLNGRCRYLVLSGNYKVKECSCRFREDGE